MCKPPTTIASSPDVQGKLEKKVCGERASIMERLVHMVESPDYDPLKG
jgi:hypothetical protein